MIEALNIAGFKSLLDIPIPCAALNILVGGNAAGKSSALQAMLMLRQSMDADGVIRQLKINGPLFAGGKAVDIFHPDSNRTLSIRLIDDKLGAVELIAQYDAETPNARELQVTSSGNDLRNWALFKRSYESFGYLNAERIGPRVRHSLAVDDENLSGPLGMLGEYVADVLTSTSNRELRKDSYAGLWKEKLALLQDESKSEREISDSLAEQADAALEYVIPGASVKGMRYEELDNAGLNYSSGIVQNIRPTHIGFGLSYSLPVVVSPLIIGAEGLLIIENPEAHLHPLGQSRIGRFLALAASQGPQTFIETHSDHVINGVRRAVKMGWINPEKVLIHFFEKDDGDDESRHEAISVDGDGALSSWPAGFFDQYENDLSKL